MCVVWCDEREATEPLSRPATASPAPSLQRASAREKRRARQRGETDKVSLMLPRMTSPNPCAVWNAPLSGPRQLRRALFLEDEDRLDPLPDALSGVCGPFVGHLDPRAKSSRVEKRSGERKRSRADIMGRSSTQQDVQRGRGKHMQGSSMSSLQPLRQESLSRSIGITSCRPDPPARRRGA